MGYAQCHTAFTFTSQFQAGPTFVQAKPILWNSGFDQSWLHLDSCVRISSEISMPSEYIPILIFAVLAAAFPAVTLVLFRFIRPTPVAGGAKLKPYECGVEPEGDTRGRD